MQSNDIILNVDPFDTGDFLPGDEILWMVVAASEASSTCKFGMGAGASEGPAVGSYGYEFIENVTPVSGGINIKPTSPGLVGVDTGTPTVSLYPEKANTTTQDFCVLQIQRVPHFTTLTITGSSAAVLTANQFAHHPPTAPTNPGGIVSFRTRSLDNQNSSSFKISVSGLGFGLGEGVSGGIDRAPTTRSQDNAGYAAGYSGCQTTALFCTSEIRGAYGGGGFANGGIGRYHTEPNDMKGLGLSISTLFNNLFNAGAFPTDRIAFGGGGGLPAGACDTHVNGAGGGVASIFAENFNGNGNIFYIGADAVASNYTSYTYGGSCQAGEGGSAGGSIRLTVGNMVSNVSGSSQITSRGAPGRFSGDASYGGKSGGGAGGTIGFAVSSGTPAWTRNVDGGLASTVGYGTGGNGTLGAIRP